MAEAALAINDKDWRTRGLLATYYAYSENPESARAAIQTALVYSDRDPEVLLYAALVSHRQHDTEGVLRALEEMITRDPSFRRYAANDPDLGTLRGNERFDRLVTP
jgi:Flp pilus assembly protein TadD